MSTRDFTLLDGGMGKTLHAQGAPFRQPEWSALALMEDPAAVRAAHDDFVRAGAEVITTNNYAVVPYHLGEDRFASQGVDLVGLSASLAREAADSADRPVRVAGSLPPIFGSYRPDLFDAAGAAPYLKSICAALAGKVDLFLAETQSCLAEAELSMRIAAAHGLPVWVAYTIKDGDFDEDADSTTPALRSGESIGDAVRLAGEGGAEAVLFNCSQPEAMLAAIDQAAVADVRMADGTPLRIGAYANAFDSDREGDSSANVAISVHRDDLNESGYTRFVTSWIDAGATIVGGCCGIMPHHIAHIASHLR